MEPAMPAFDWRSALMMLIIGGIIVAGLLASARRTRSYDDYVKQRRRDRGGR